MTGKIGLKEVIQALMIVLVKREKKNKLNTEFNPEKFKIRQQKKNA